MLEALARLGTSHGWRCEVVLPEQAERASWIATLRDAGADVRYLKIESRARLWRRIAAIVAESGEPTILHTHFTTFDVAAALAALGRRRMAVYWHVHSPLRREPAVRIRNTVRFSMLGRSVAAILCVSPDIAEAVRQRHAPRSKVHFVPNGIETSRFPLVRDAERRAARHTLGIPQDATVILHFGWDWRRKGGDLFLEAIQMLEEQRAARLHAISIGADRMALEQAHKLGLQNSFVVHPTTDNVRALYAAADLLVSPSRAEGMPFALTEALCSGVAVVASDLPGQAWQCRGLEACRLARLDARNIADGIESLLSRDRDRAQADAEKARRSIVARMDLQAFAERIESLYEGAFGLPGS